MDIQTSPSHNLLLAICASFVDTLDHFQNILIALCMVYSYSGLNQWESLRPVLKDYGIIENIGTLISDNSTTNDMLCHVMATYLSTEK